MHELIVICVCVICVCEFNDLFWPLHVYFVVQCFSESLMCTQDLSPLSKGEDTREARSGTEVFEMSVCSK